MAILNSSVITGDLSVTGQIHGASDQIYASIGTGASEPTGITAGNKHFCIVSSLPANPDPDTIYFVISQ